MERDMQAMGDDYTVYDPRAEKRGTKRGHDDDEYMNEHQRRLKMQKKMDRW